MTGSADTAARVRALTELKSTLLVEAAAGTGKTALIAGRVAMALISGIAPRQIAAITFTESAASELGARINKYVSELLSRRVPNCLREVLPAGVTDDQHAILMTAAQSLDELAVTTIHGFCQAMIHSYAVEADIDPGARMMDAPQAAAAFDGVFERWLRRRLTVATGPADPIAALSKEDPRRVAATLKSLAAFRRDHRAARAVSADLTIRLDLEFADAVAAFRQWISRTPQAEPRTVATVADLETLAKFYANAFDPAPDFPHLWRFAHPPTLASMRKDTFDLIAPQHKRAWQRVAGPDDGARLSAKADELFARANYAYQALLGRIATAVVETLAGEIDEVITDYDHFKHAVAVLDFDDLLRRARSLVCEHDEVRRALGERYQQILVDEFQDTDPIQAEIFFRIAASDIAPRWQDSSLRPGALFMVGDPKQAIYRFRGADIGSYGEARDAIRRQWPAHVLQIASNFRSAPGILDYVNLRFRSALAGSGQPGYVELTPTRSAADHGLPCVAKRTLEIAPPCKVNEIRDVEAASVAEICDQLIGNLKVRDEHGNLAVLQPGGVALLAPTGTQLWRYERALEARGLPIAPRAGRNLFRRQEVQDLFALARTLADSDDTLAFGSVMRGPLVGLTEEELLDITAQLPPREGAAAVPSRFSMRTDPSAVSQPVAQDALSILRDLKRRAFATTPALLLSEAVERLAIRALLVARESNRISRADANVEQFLELARSYGMRGLKRFVHDVANEWATGNAERPEGRVDSDGAIELVTMHSSKGLEWHVVVLINTTTVLINRSPFVHRMEDNTLHWMVGEVKPPELTLALEAENQMLAGERQRLWYVACTRAKDLLVIPAVPSTGHHTWAQVIEQSYHGLPELAIPGMRPVPRRAPDELQNLQTRDRFDQELAAIRARMHVVKWVRPSEQDPDLPSVAESLVVDSSAEELEVPVPVGAGRIRGLLLHKLIEEVLNGEISEDVEELTGRAQNLITQLAPGSSRKRDLPLAEELAQTVLATLHLPEIASMRANLMPELPVYKFLSAEPDRMALVGRVDAAVVEGNKTLIVVDWKSDVEPATLDIQIHIGQLREYMRATGAPRGALVYMTPGIVQWVEPSTGA
jgi:CRISPR-associated exonuclease Cas4